MENHPPKVTGTSAYPTVLMGKPLAPTAAMVDGRSLMTSLLWITFCLMTEFVAPDSMRNEIGESYLAFYT